MLKRKKLLRSLMGIARAKRLLPDTASLHDQFAQHDYHGVSTTLSGAAMFKKLDTNAARGVRLTSEEAQNVAELSHDATVEYGEWLEKVGYADKQM